MNLIIYDPVIVKKDGPYEAEEGCLSLDGVRKTTRYQNIEVEYTDSSWKKQRMKLSGWSAQICQHEIDHTIFSMQGIKRINYIRNAVSLSHHDHRRAQGGLRFRK